MKPKSVLVIGAGIGGICAAIHLAKSGMQVTVFEKNMHPGGRCDRFSREGHIFDTGPTLLIMPHIYEAEFQALGASMQEALELQRVDPTYRLIFDDGSQLALTSDLKSMQDQLEQIEPGSFQGLLKYLQEGDRHYRIGIEKLVNRDFRSARDFFSPGLLPVMLQVKPLVNHYRNMASYFANSRLKAAFSFQDVYMGLSPFEAPATFSMMPYTELAHGVWFPRRGMYGVVEVLMELAVRAGVEFIYDTTVERIDVAGGRAVGITVEGGRAVRADIILANADLPFVYENLLPPDKTARQLRRKRFSCSVISFFWGVDRRYPQIGPHTLFLADDYRENFTSIIDNLDLPANPSLYVHAPARLQSSMAPEGQDTLIAIVPVGHMQEPDDRDWGEIRDMAREQVYKRLALLGIMDLQEHIKFEMSFAPPTWKNKYNLVKGSTHGLSHNLTQLAWFRPHNRHARYPNLYFVGASTHPGTGMPTAMISGRLVSKRILDEQGA